MSWFLYRNDKKLEGINSWIKYLLFTLRFLVIFFLTFLLLSPVFRYLKIHFEKPEIIIAFDNSSSMLIGEKSDGYKQKAVQFIDNLKEDYELTSFLFGEKLSPDSKITFEDLETNFDPLVEHVKAKYVNENVGALVVFSDAIFNKGNNPVYSLKDFSFPVYTVTVGDTSRKKDILIKNVSTNEITFSGNFFPVEMQVDAIGFDRNECLLSIYQNGKLIKTLPVKISDNDYSAIVQTELQAVGKGLQTYDIKIEEKKGEFSVKNNTRQFVIDVLDDRKKILILSSCPHPDIASLQRSLQRNQNISIENSSPDDFKNPMVQYQLVILYQLPSKNMNINRILKEINDNRIPVLFIIGQNSDILALNALNTGIEIKSGKDMKEQVAPYLNQGFTLFETDGSFREIVPDLPPLVSPFGDYQISSEINVLMQQEIRGIVTSTPLIAFNPDYKGRKCGFIIGEGIWQWRMKDYLMNSNHDQFDAFINKCIDFLSLNVKKDRFMIFHERLFNENEEVFFKSELYNETFELVNSPEVLLTITDDNKKEYKFQFLKSEKAYFLNCGRLPVGAYHYTASTEFGNVKYNKTGEFRVVALNIEDIELTANDRLMKNLALQSGGKNYSINDLAKLIEDLKSDETIQTRSQSIIDLVDLIELRWSMFLLCLFLGIEWFLRKFYGTY